MGLDHPGPARSRVFGLHLLRRVEIGLDVVLLALALSARSVQSAWSGVVFATGLVEFGLDVVLLARVRSVGQWAWSGVVFATGLLVQSHGVVAEQVDLALSFCDQWASSGVAFSTDSQQQVGWVQSRVQL